MKFRKKPVIEALQWQGLGKQTSIEVVKPYDPYGEMSSRCEYCKRFMSEHGWIQTLEGGHIVCPGDWIIQGVKGEFYPCKSDIFEQTYEMVE